MSFNLKPIDNEFISSCFLLGDRPRSNGQDVNQNYEKIKKDIEEYMRIKNLPLSLVYTIFILILEIMLLNLYINLCTL